MNQLSTPTSITKMSSQVDYILLDGSASMSPKWMDSLAAIDSYISTLKAANVQSHIYLHIFSSRQDIDLCGFDGRIGDYTTCTNLQLPMGSTPLYDAIAIMGKRMNDWDPPKAHCTIVTDGEEAGSTHTDITQARAILDFLRAKGWPVTFIGADFSNASLASSLGVDPHSAIGVQKKLLSAAAKSLANKRVNHYRGADDIAFSSDEQQQFGGYLAAS